MWHWFVSIFGIKRELRLYAKSNGDPLEGFKQGKIRELWKVSMITGRKLVWGCYS